MSDKIIESLRRSANDLAKQAEDGPYEGSGQDTVKILGNDGTILYLLLRMEEHLERIEELLKAGVKHGG